MAEAAARREARILGALHGEVHRGVLLAELPRAFHHARRPRLEIGQGDRAFGHAPAAGGEQAAADPEAGRSLREDQAVAQHVGHEDDVHVGRHHAEADPVALLFAQRFDDRKQRRRGPSLVRQAAVAFEERHVAHDHVVVGAAPAVELDAGAGREIVDDRMDELGVVRLDVVLQQHLPVPRHRIGRHLRRDRHHGVEVVARHVGLELGHGRRERPRRRIEIDEDEAVPQLDLELRQRRVSP